MGNKSSSLLQDEEILLISEETGFSPAQIERLYSRFTSLDKSGINGSLSRQDFLRVPELAINPLCDRIVQMFFADCDDDHERINFRQFMKVLATFRSSAKPIKSRNVSRQESIQSVLDSLTENGYARHSRHASCDNFGNYYQSLNQQHHHTTNQHSVHYVASNTHLPSLQHQHNNHHHHHPSFHNNNHILGSNGIKSNSTQLNKSQQNLLDPEEPANSVKQKLHFMFKIYDVNNDDLLDLDDLIEILKMMVGTYVDDDRIKRIAERTLREADKNCDGCIDFEEFCSAFTHKDIEESLRVKFACSS